MTAFSLRDLEIEGYAALHLTSADARLSAIVVPALSMLTYSLRVDDMELLYQGAGLRDYANTRKLRGIPLLHPWANRLGAHAYTVAGSHVRFDPTDPNVTHDGNGLPIHGLLSGAHAWQVTARHADNDGAAVTATFPFAAHPELLRIFPFPHELTLSIALDAASLTFTTTLHAPTGETDVPIAFGFHPYFRLPSARADWHLAMPVSQRLELDGQMLPTGRTTPCAFPLSKLGRRTFDDGFTDVAPGSRFLLRDRRIALAVEFVTGFPFAQVYAPADREFICFEPMTAPTNALASGYALRRVAPGTSATATWSIHVEPSC